VEDREFAHAAINAVLARQRLWCTRVHDVRATRDALAAVQRLEAAR
jgi:dihydropteroate synthase